MDERIMFIAKWLEKEHSVSALCQHFGISRKTGHKWIGRYKAEGAAGLKEKLRAPLWQARATPLEIEAAILDLAWHYRGKRGPKKLHAILRRQQPDVRWPAASTIGAILKRHGLVTPRRRCRKSPPYEQPLAHCHQCNDVWSADLKGWFTTKNGERCDPLTITDNHSRFLLRCQLVRPPQYRRIQPVFESAFREYGLPVAIRTDNGAPFASTAVGGLSRLSIWWLHLGIRPERITPGKPQQNPRHERMHRSLKDDVCRPVRTSWASQQRALDDFRDDFNHIRPHETLDQNIPADHYTPSTRAYPEIVPEITYPDDMQRRTVRRKGDFTWKGHHIFLSELLAGELIGLRQVSDERQDIYFGPIRLAQLDTVNAKLIHLIRKRPQSGHKNT